MRYSTPARRETEAPAWQNRRAGKQAAGALRIGAPNDVDEQEADRVADAAMSGGAARRHWSISGTNMAAGLQRKCSCGGPGECEACKQENLQRKAVGAAPAPHVAPRIVHEELRSPGQPLDTGTLSFMESRFGYDFGHVRIHAGTRAAESAGAVNALAYTVGSDVVFGHGQYAPQSSAGRSLLAHELSHTLQQVGAPKGAPARLPAERTRTAAAVPNRLEVAEADDPLEVEAESAARGLRSHNPEAAGTLPAARTSAAPRVFRQQPPPGGGGPPPGPKRIVYLDADVLSQIAGGNKAAAEKLMETRAQGADVRISRAAYNEAMRGKPQHVAARRVIVEQLNITVDEGKGLQGRMATYETQAGKGVKIQTKDLPGVAAAKQGGGEIWSFDGGVKTTAGELGVKLADESKIPSIKSPADVRAGLDNVSLHDFSVAPDGTVSRKPPGSGPSGGTPAGGGPPAGPAPGGGKPSGSGAAAAGGKAPAINLAPLAEGAPRPATQAQIIARERVLAQLESETAESVKLSGRIQAFGAIFGALMQVYTAFSAVSDAKALQAEGTLFGKAQENAESLESRSASDLSDVTSETDKISLLQSIDSINDGMQRADSEALFDLSASLGDWSMSLIEPADQFGAMAAKLEAQASGLAVMSDFYEKMAKLPVDPLAGTVPQAQAFSMWVSIDKLIWPLRAAGANYRSAATILKFYSDYTGSLAHEANKAAWVLALRRIAEAAKKASAAHPGAPAGQPDTPQPPDAGGFPSVKEQQGTVCPNCHRENAPAQKLMIPMKPPTKKDLKAIKAWIETPKPPPVPAGEHPTPPGVKLDPNAGAFPSLAEQQGKQPCPNCHSENKPDVGIGPGMFKQPTEKELQDIAQWINNK